MGCCNSLRAELNHELVNTEATEGDILTESDLKDVTFEYIGDRSLKVKGAFSGTTYYFRFQGYQLTVPHNDSFALMAESELIVVG